MPDKSGAPHTLREPGEEVVGHQGMPLSVGVVRLRHHRTEDGSGSDRLLKCGEAIDQTHMVLLSQVSDLFGLLVQWIVRIVQLCLHVGRWPVPVQGTDR